MFRLFLSASIAVFTFTACQGQCVTYGPNERLCEHLNFFACSGSLCPPGSQCDRGGKTFRIKGDDYFETDANGNSVPHMIPSVVLVPPPGTGFVEVASIMRECAKQGTCFCKVSENDGLMRCYMNLLGAAAVMGPERMLGNVPCP